MSQDKSLASLLATSAFEVHIHGTPAACKTRTKALLADWIQHSERAGQHAQGLLLAQEWKQRVKVCEMLLRDCNMFTPTRRHHFEMNTGAEFGAPAGSFFYGKKSCHMFADTLEELHAMALKIGLKKSWFQDNGQSAEHYDLVASRRAAAVALGAIELETRGQICYFGNLSRERRGQKKLFDGKHDELPPDKGIQLRLEV